MKNKEYKQCLLMLTIYNIDENRYFVFFSPDIQNIPCFLKELYLQGFALTVKRIFAGHFCRILLIAIYFL